MKQKTTIPIIYILLLISNILTAIIYNLLNETIGLIPMRISLTFINGIGFTVLTILCTSLIQRFLKINLNTPLLTINIFISIIECFLLANFYTLITPSTFFVLLGTNSEEAKEFIHSYSTIYTWMLIATAIFATVYGRKFIKKNIIIQVPHPLNNKWFKFSFIISTLMAYLGLTYYAQNIRHMPSYQILTGIERVWHSIMITHRDIQQYQEYLHLPQQSPSITLTKNEADIPYVILILGESASKLHMESYGYPLKTTPLLSKRIQQQEIVLFYNVETPHAVTHEAIPEIMTFHCKGDKMKWYQYPTLPQIMKSAHYYTIWISNQDSFTFGNNNTTASIANTADSTIFTHQRHASEETYGFFDEAILPVLHRQLKSIHQKLCICIHLMGSHHRYTNRYPSSFNVFKPSSKIQISDYNKQKTISEYDNTILYTDFVCNEIVKSFEDKDALIIYLSDHGEEVYDTRNMCGHSSDNPTSPMLQVPLWIWTSKTFKEKRPLLQQRIERSAHNIFNTTNTVFTIMDICNLESQEFDRSKSLIYQP